MQATSEPRRTGLYVIRKPQTASREWCDVLPEACSLPAPGLPAVASRWQHVSEVTFGGTADRSITAGPARGASRLAGLHAGRGAAGRPRAAHVRGVRPAARLHGRRRGDRGDRTRPADRRHAVVGACDPRRTRRRGPGRRRPPGLAGPGGLPAGRAVDHRATDPAGSRRRGRPGPAGRAGHRAARARARAVPPAAAAPAGRARRTGRHRPRRPGATCSPTRPGAP